MAGKTSVTILEVDQVSSLPNLRSDRGGFAFESTTPKYWDGSSWSTFSGAGSGVSTWDEMYDNDKALSIDSTTLTFTLTHATNDGLTLAAQSGKAGAVLAFNNAGDGSDIDGTSDTWSVSKAGAAVFTAIAMADNELITLGTGSDATIGWNGSVLNIAGITDFDNNVTLAASATIVQAGVAGSTVFTITAGDAAMSDGSLAITDADNAATFSVTNATVTTGNTVVITADAATEGSILYIDNGGAALTSGYYINCNDDGTSDFTVGADGATVITTAAATTAALSVTGIQTSQDMVTFDNTSGVIASNKAILFLDAGGNVADGGNILRLAPTGTPVEGSVGIEFVGASKVMQAMSLDSDSVNNSVALFNGGGAIADNKAVVEITADGTPAAAGSNMLRVDGSGLTATNKPTLVEVIGTGKDVSGLYIDADNTTTHGVSIDGSGALASGGRMLLVDNDGTPAAVTDAVAEITFTGTATNNPIVASINNSTKDALPLLVTSNVAAATRAVAVFVQDSTTGATPVLTLDQDDVSEEFIDFVGTAGSGNSIDTTNTTPAAVVGSAIVAYNGTKVRVALYAAAGWS